MNIFSGCSITTFLRFCWNLILLALPEKASERINIIQQYVVYNRNSNEWELRNRSVRAGVNGLNNCRFIILICCCWKSTEVTPFLLYRIWGLNFQHHLFVFLFTLTFCSFSLRQDCWWFIYIICDIQIARILAYE